MSELFSAEWMNSLKDGWNSEPKVKDKLAEISAAFALIAKKDADAKTLDATYQTKIDEGDRLLAKREYQIAKRAYEGAIEIKPKEAYPKSKIEEINGLLAGMAKDTQYAGALKEGSDYVAQKKYSDAKLAYQAASEIKPSESFPKDKIKEIDGLIAKQKKSQKLAQYKRLMGEAEAKFNTKDYTESKTLYQSASEVNPSAQYPKDRIKEIERLLLLAANKGEAQKAKKQKYVTFIERGDMAFSSKDYPNSRASFKKALALFPEETYPKQKVRELDKLLAAEKEIPQEINFSNEAEKKKFMSSMASKYGEGIHQENYESKSGKKVRRVIVVRDGVADEYREVKQPWGATYFFKNGKSVSRAIMFKETKN